jgi:hypothetical protein
MRLINNPPKSGTAIRETEKRITFITLLYEKVGADVCRKMKLSIFYLRNYVIKEACAKVSNAISPATQNRINRSAIRTLFLAESTHTRARKRNIGKEQM